MMNVDATSGYWRIRAAASIKEFRALAKRYRCLEYQLSKPTFGWLVAGFLAATSGFLPWIGINISF
jgi:hypothetical protein